jgi:precorrin-3B synthase
VQYLDDSRARATQPSAGPAPGFAASSGADAHGIVNAPHREGWCPGALRPMATGDGLLVRLRLTGGILSFRNARAIAACADRYGNGLIDLSSRANLQLRGVSSETLGDLTAELERLRLLDASAEAEAVRNIVASPLAGIDPTAAIDIRPVVQALEAALAQDPMLHRLPAKFGFLVDDAGHLGLSRVGADVRFEALATADGPRFTIRLAGGEDECIGECAPDDVADGATRLAAAFLALRGDTPDAPRRLRDVVEGVGVAAFAQAAGFARRDFFNRAPRSFDMSRVVGHQHVGAMHYVGVAMPFGRLSGEALTHLAALAEHHGARDLRLTPWRTILVADLPAQRASSLLTELGTDRFILSADDPRLSVAACPGAPACRSATTPVHDDALRLAELLRRPLPGIVPSDAILLHVSGCAKGCAHALPARFTLVGNACRYDLVEHATARDAPVVSGLAAADLRAALAARLEQDAKEAIVAKLP